jgi:hypothetical protein
MKRATLEQLLPPDCAKCVVRLNLCHPAARLIKELRFYDDRIVGARTRCHWCDRLSGEFFSREPGMALCTPCHAYYHYWVMTGWDFNGA